MELIYLWVKEYKNIKEQGYNFTSHIRYKYEKEKLSVEVGTNDLEDFFGKNIKVTAIVGKNGSGKSSIFEILTKLQLGDIDSSLEKGVICILKDEDKHFIFTNLKIEGYQTSELLTIVRRYSTVFYSSNFSNGYFDRFVDEFSTPAFSTLPRDNQDDINHETKHLKVQSLTNLLFNSSRFIVKKASNSKDDIKDLFNIKEMQAQYKLAKTICILEFLHSKRDNVPFKIENDPKVSISILPRDGKQLTLTTGLSAYIKDFFKFPEFMYGTKEQKVYDSFVTKILLVIDKAIKEGNVSGNTLILDLTDSYTFVESYVTIYTLNSSLKEQFFDFSFRNMSSGEESFLLAFNLLSYALVSLPIGKGFEELKDVVIFLDEIENNLNPEWQQALIQYLTDYFQKEINQIYIHSGIQLKIHFVIATHSPVLLSDIPKNHVIFMNDSVQTDTLEQEETFGANIHTLLSDSFFMQDGLMGKFAKEKINEVIDNLQDEKKSLSQKEIKHIISIIGEPYLQLKLEQMYNEKFDVDNELEKLQKQQEKIQLKIQQLTKEKSENA